MDRELLNAEQQGNLWRGTLLGNAGLNSPCHRELFESEQLRNLPGAV
jgi:hypothetical protein